MKNTIFYDYPILGTTDELEKIQNRIGVLNEISLVCPVGNCKNRKMLIDKLSSHFTHFPNLIHPTAQISKHAELGEGNLFSQNVVFVFLETKYNFWICRIGSYSSVCFGIYSRWEPRSCDK